MTNLSVFVEIKVSNATDIACTPRGISLQN